MQHSPNLFCTWFPANAIGWCHFQIFSFSRFFIRRICCLRLYFCPALSCWYSNILVLSFLRWTFYIPRVLMICLSQSHNMSKIKHKICYIFPGSYNNFNYHFSISVVFNGKCYIVTLCDLFIFSSTPYCTKLPVFVEKTFRFISWSK
jgi:hypothetical protein